MHDTTSCMQISSNLSTN
uniref:Uncharacterized protein n=1 Tax=Arundo donax TaxID=35708 RepID=A0A0A9APD2_ARUDO